MAVSDSSAAWRSSMKPAAAADGGWLDERAAALESLTAIRRAGADVVVSYWTKELARWL